MLDLRPACECCGAALPPAAPARICSFECTFCVRCATHHGACPNCGGDLVARPVRPASQLARHPASTHGVAPSRVCACPP